MPIITSKFLSLLLILFAFSSFSFLMEDNVVQIPFFLHGFPLGYIFWNSFFSVWVLDCDFWFVSFSIVQCWHYPLLYFLSSESSAWMLAMKERLKSRGKPERLDVPCLSFLKSMIWDLNFRRIALAVLFGRVNRLS